jgi:hypothetical protein
MSKAIVIDADFSANSFDHVSFNIIHATGITVTPSTLSMSAIGATSQLAYTVTPANAQDAVMFTSSNSDVATVTSGGLVTVTGCGSCTITATAGNVSDTCSVTVVVPMTSGYVQAVCGKVYAGSANNTLTAVNVYTTSKDHNTGCYAIYAVDSSASDLPLHYPWVNTSTNPYTYQTMEWIQTHNPWSQLAGWAVPIKLPHNCTKIRFKQLSADYGVYPLFFKYNQPARDYNGMVVSRLESPKIDNYSFAYEAQTVVDVPTGGWDSFTVTWVHKNGQESGAFVSMSSSDLAQFTVEFL